MTVAATSSTATNPLQTFLQQQAANVAADKSATAANQTSTGSALASANSATTIGSNFNTFIKILTTQLKSQDPTNATDPNQFTQELVQFAGVEQQLNTNNNLQTLINLQKTNNGPTSALGYIGKFVEAPTKGSFVLNGGSTEVGYTLPTTASSVIVTVKDASGKEVAKLSTPTTVGTNYFTWDGKDGNGIQQPDGNYTFGIAATDATTQLAESITDMRAIAKVTGVTTNSDGTTSLAVGFGLSVNTSAVAAVYSSDSLPTSTKVTGKSATADTTT